jgi:cytidylate kinase
VVPKIIQSVRHLADAGHVILVGRGAGIVTGGMPNVFHARVIATLPRRIERVQKLETLSPNEAAKFITRKDRARERYVRAHFGQRVDNDLHYHLVLNTDLIPLPDAAELIADGARRQFQGTIQGKD